MSGLLCKLPLLLAGGFMLISCGLTMPKDQPKLGEEFCRVIPGHWESVSSAGGVRGHMHKTFFADGTAEGVIHMQEHRRGLTLQAPPLRFKSRWRVVGGTVETYEIRTPVYKDAFPPGIVIHDQLISVTPTRIDSIGLESRDREILRRVSKEGKPF